MITHRVPLEEVSEAYRMFSAKLDNCIKPVLIPPSAEYKEKAAMEHESMEIEVKSMKIK
jgi:hypothetical protein